jgi:hypothetical protein
MILLRKPFRSFPLFVSLSLLLLLVFLPHSSSTLLPGVFRTGIAAEGGAPLADPVWIPIDDPESVFWGNSGIWTAQEGAYTGIGTGSLTQIYSYTALTHFGDSIEAIPVMTGYRVRMTLHRPIRFSSVSSRVVAGAKNTGIPASGSALLIDSTRFGLEINCFGDVTWNGGNNCIAWYQVDPAIDYGGAFVLEIHIAPQEIEIRVNDRSLFTYVPEDNEERGLLAAAGIGVSPTLGVTFSSMSYAIDTLADTPALGVEASLTSPDEITVRITECETDDLFQVWVRRECLSDLGENQEPAFTWILVKGFPDDLEKIERDEGTKCSTYPFVISAEDRSEEEEVMLFVRIKPPEAGSALKGQELCVVPCREGSFVLSEITINDRPIDAVYDLPDSCAEEQLVIRARITGTPFGDDTVRYTFLRSGALASPLSSTPVNFIILQDGVSDTYSFTVSESGGIYSFRVKAYSTLYPSLIQSERSFLIRVNASTVPRCLFDDDACLSIADLRVGQPLVFDLSSSVGGTGTDPRYRYTLGEPWMTPILSQAFTGFGGLSRIMDAPGVYRITAFVSHKANTHYDDGLLRNFRVLRTDTGAIRGQAIFREIKVRINGVEVEGEVGSSSSLTVAPGDLVELEVFPDGLYGPEIPSEEESSLYRYSLWRLDVAGYRKVRAYASDPVFSFRPAAPGHYALQLRVRGLDAESYESLASIAVTATGYVPIDDLSLDLSIGGVPLEEGAFPAPLDVITLTAQAGEIGGAGETGEAGDTEDTKTFLYRFDVSDSFLGSSCLKGFSPDNSAVWIPRKAGIYRIVVRCQDPSSLGFGDRVTIREIEVRDTD